MKRSICILLALIVACLVLSSCGTNDEVIVTTGADTEKEEVQLQLSGDFGNSDFRILIAGQPNAICNDFAYEDGEAKSTLEKAQYERLLTIEDNFNVDVVAEIKKGYSSASRGTPGPGYNDISLHHASGTPGYDLCLVAAYDVSQLAANGYLYDMNSVPGINLDASYWDHNAVESLGVRDVVFFTAGDISVANKNSAFCFMFNKRIAEDYNIENLYETVKNGKWTIEKMTSIAKTISEDLNSDGTYDGEDLYGLLLIDDFIVGMVNAAGQRCCTINDNGEIELTLYNETTINALDKVADIAYDSRHALQFQRQENPQYGEKWWQNNQGLFFTTHVGELPKYRDMENDFGVLPYPKLNEAQANHYSTVFPYQTQFVCIPALNRDINKTGILTEALAYYGEQIVTPALYNVSLVGQTTRDAESQEMLDIIFDNLVYDIGYYYQVGEYNMKLLEYLQKNNSSWATMYDMYRNLADAQLKTINKYYSTAVADWEKTSSASGKTAKKNLEAVINMANVMRAEDYPAEQYASFASALEKANDVYNSQSAKKDTVEAAEIELLAAMDEVAKYNSGNFARGKTVIVSSDLNGYGWTKDKMVDGNRENASSSSQRQGWTSNYATDADHEESVIIDLGAHYVLDQIHIMPAGYFDGDEVAEGFPKSFTLSVSKDREAWTVVADENDYPAPPVGEIQKFVFDAVTARYVKLDVSSINMLSNQGNAYRVQIAEFEVYRADETLAKQVLGELIATAESFSADDYFAEPFAQFEAVLATSRDVYNTAGTTFEELIDAKEALLAAIDILGTYKMNVKNLALGKPVSASSDIKNYGWEAAKLTDGNRTNLSNGQYLGWTSNDLLNEDHTEWVIIDLGEISKFDRVHIMPAGNKTGEMVVCGFPRSYILSVSADGNEWTECVSASDLPLQLADVMQELVFDTSVEARYVKFEATSLNPISNSGNNYRMQLAELEIYLGDE